MHLHGHAGVTNNWLPYLSYHLNSRPVVVLCKTEVLKVENNNNGLNVSAFLMVDKQEQ